MSRDNANEIDASAELARAAGHGQAGFDDVRKGTPPGVKLGMTLVLLIGLAVGVGLIYMWYKRPVVEGDGGRGPVVSNTLPALKLNNSGVDKKPSVEPAKQDSLMFTQPPPADTKSLMDFQIGLDPVKERRLRSGMQATTQSADTSNSDSNSSRDFTESGSFAGKLEPLRLAPSVAGKLGNRDFLITQGSMLDCTLRPRLSSAQAGMFTCMASTDTYSANGKVKLIDKGTKFVGFQSGGLAQGQDRIFVIWSRLETPSGVIVNLDSPGTGPLGEAGLGGKVDHHFMERFGNAIMLSLIFDTSNYLTSRNKSNDSISFDNTSDGAQDVIGKVLEHSMDIPPTLYKNQGERVSIFVARDLDFSKVYDIKPASSLSR